VFCHTIHSMKIFKRNDGESGSSSDAKNSKNRAVVPEDDVEILSDIEDDRFVLIGM
jgi:hypothetical protein